MSDKDFNRLDPFVPQRDEAPARRQAPAKSAPAHEVPQTVVHSGGGFWKVLSVITLMALVAVGAFAWQQSQVLAGLTQRFDELKSRIESTDESLNQSGAALGIKIKEQGEQLDKQWTEIKKLWGVSYDTNRKAIAENKTAIDGQVAVLKKLQTSIAVLQKSVEQSNQSVAGIKSNSLAISAQTEELAEKLAAVSGSVTRLENSLKQQQGGLAGKVAEHDEAIRSIDTYRRQTNEQLTAIRRQLGMQ